MTVSTLVPTLSALVRPAAWPVWLLAALSGVASYGPAGAELSAELASSGGVELAVGLAFVLSLALAQGGGVAHRALPEFALWVSSASVRRLSRLWKPARGLCVVLGSGLRALWLLVGTRYFASARESASSLQRKREQRFSRRRLV